MDALIARLDLWLRANRPQYHSKLLPGASDSAIDALERRAGAALPPLLKQMLAWRDGWWHVGWVPYLMTLSDDYLCVDLIGSFGGKPGQILKFWHDDSERPIVYPSFDAWLRTLVEALEAAMLTTEDRFVVPLDDEARQAFVAVRNPGYPIKAEAGPRPRRTRPRPEPA